VFMRWHQTGAAEREVCGLTGRIVNEPLQFEPGSRFAYSNSGYVVLGAVVEAVSGQDYYDCVQTHAFTPAGMTHTGWYTPDQVPTWRTATPRSTRPPPGSPATRQAAPTRPSTTSSASPRHCSRTRLSA